jgi:signal peptide peptidase SppA
MCIRDSTIRDGEIPQWSYRTEVFNSVAVIPVIGPIYSRGSYYYGGSSVNLIAKDFTSALEDNSIKAIILNVNSPGGEITGVSELANLIYESRGKKPIVAYISGMGASAAIWIATSADKVVIADTGEAGSIGVVSVHTSYKDYEKKLGIQEIEIVSSQSPKKRLDVTTDAGKADVQRIVDELADVFVASVARNRNVTTEKVINDFGNGSVLVGKSAVDAGLVDETGSLESVLKSLNVNKPTLSLGGIPMNIEELKTQHPETYAAALALGKQAGVDESKVTADISVKAAAKKEQDRILGILSYQKVAGAKTIIDNAIKNPEATKESVAVQILEMQSTGTQTLQTAIQDDNTSLVNTIQKVESSAPTNTSEASEIDAFAKKMAAIADKLSIDE